MQPPHSQLPTDDTSSPVPRNLKRGGLLVLLVVAVVAGLIALFMPKAQVESRNAPTDAQHITGTPAIDRPKH